MRALAWFGSPLLSFLVFASFSAGAFGQVPTDVQEPGTQPGEVSGIETVDKCNNCHGGYDVSAEPWHLWAGGMMSHATRDPIFWATVAVAEDTFGGAGDLCLRCHTPDGWLGGRSVPTDGSALGPGDANGVSCDACHRMTNPDRSEHLGVQVAPFLANDELNPATGYYGSGMYVIWNASSKLGPYADAQPKHQWLPSSFHRDARFCGTCHDVSNPVVGDLAHNNGAQVPLQPGTFSGVPGAPVNLKAAFNNFPFQYGVVERTFSEHQSSAFATLLVSQYPSLPADLRAGAIETAWQAALAGGVNGNYADGTPRSFTCQTCHMRPTTGYGANKPGIPLRPDLPTHDQTGGNAWTPQTIQYLDAQGKLVIGGGLTAAEQQALQDGSLRAIDNLQQAAALEVAGNTVRVINLTGHKLISGFPEGRRMWLRVTWRDGAGQVVRQDGAYGPLQVVLQGQLLAVDTILDPESPHTRIYQAHYAMTEEWASQLVSLGFPASLPLSFDRITGAVTKTLGQLAAQPSGSHHETFHFVINNMVAYDNRIPPYGFSFDQASARNALPVPASQYGDPGPGGVFDYFDVVDLDPPAGAESAVIELLYQSTSWEYVQFLRLANQGGVPHLASTGQNLLDAWLNTGMAAPIVMETATWTAPFDPWTDLGSGLAGTNGVPTLAGIGGLVGGEPVTLILDNALENTTANLIVGLAALHAPFYGGTLVPRPDLLILGFPTGAGGGVTLGATWPTGLPSGFSFYFQYWISDPAAPQGLAASNALRAATP
ncbi:MAG: hypothetical protein HY812_03195 [Planctomycetes bacterium]|nr:hypothetical protein [Planctomycetota bacterium]